MAETSSLRMEIDDKRLKKALRLFPDEMKKEVRKIFTAHGRRVRDAIKSRLFSPFSGRSRRIQRRSGKLSRSFKTKAHGRTLGSSRMIVTSRLDYYAGVQEFGKKSMKPRSRKWLAMPLPAALRKSGTPKKKGPRDWQNTFVRPVKGNQLMVFQRRKGRKPLPLYLYMRQTRIPGRLGLRKLNREMAPQAVRKINLALKQVMR